MPVPQVLAKAVPSGLKMPQNDKKSLASGPKTKTPQDEALAFFSEGSHSGEDVQVWELWLEDDGGPGEKKSVSRRRRVVRRARTRAGLYRLELERWAKG